MAKSGLPSVMRPCNWTWPPSSRRGARSFFSHPLSRSRMAQHPLWRSVFARMVRPTEEAGLESPRLGLWTGVAGPLHLDGLGRRPNRRRSQGSLVVFRPTGAQRAVDLLLFWASLLVAGSRCELAA